MIFANMPDELAWSSEPVQIDDPRARELLVQYEIKSLARVQAPAVRDPEPKVSLHEWRRPGTRRVPTTRYTRKRFSAT